MSAARSVRAPSRVSQRKCRSRAAQILQNINSPEISWQCVRLYLRIQVIGRRRNSSQSQCVRLAGRQQLPGEVETHDQVGESLRILWRKVWSGLPPASEAALLPQGMQGQLPCKKGEGLCARQKVVELPVSRNIAISARMSSGDDVRFGSKADIKPLNHNVRFAPESGHQAVSPRCPLCANSGHWSLHSITSSASARMRSGIARPSAFAVLTLSTNSNPVDCITGSSAGFSPLRIRAT